MSIAHLRKLTDDYFNNVEEEESIFRLILNNIDELIFIYDETGNVVETNESGKSLLNALPSDFSSLCITNKQKHPKVNIDNKQYKISSVELPSNKRACIARAIS